MNFREINFGHELTLEWSPGSDNDDGASDDEL